MGSRQDIAQYYAMTTAVDAATGQLLRELDQLGLAENTIVLFSSDHGDMLGSHGRRLKRKPWEESIRVPGLLRWPARLRGGARWNGFFTHVDFAPTLLGLAGLRPPQSMQGRDLSRAILSGREPRNDSAFFQIFGPFAGDGTEAGWRAVRTRRHLYARLADRSWLLYDLERDPAQRNNLATDPTSRPLLQQLDQRLTRWMHGTGDGWSFNWTHPVEDNGRLYRHQTFRTIAEYLAWAVQHPDLDR
jgi:arylsulfatase A-like enzyme